MHSSKTAWKEIGLSICEIMSVTDTTHSDALELKKDCGITPCYGSPKHYLLRSSMGISVSQVKW